MIFLSSNRLESGGGEGKGTAVRTAREREGEDERERGRVRERERRGRGREREGFVMAQEHMASGKRGPSWFLICFGPFFGRLVVGLW